MKRITLTSENTQEILAEACAVLARGGLVVFPTETMYGLAADATNPDAVGKALRHKERPAGKAISVLVADKSAMAAIVQLNESAEQVIHSFLPGPVTVICKDLGVVDSRLPSELGTLGVRISSHPFAMALAAAYKRPITATSANPSGGARPYAIESLLAQLSPIQKAEVDLIVDAGTLPKNEPSTVIDTTQQVQKIVRSGQHVTELAPPFISRSEEDTQEYAARLLQSFAHVLPEKALVFALEGDMGMGKTQFAKGIGTALGITQPITSPTFSLIKEYPGSWNERTIDFVHMDLWRLENVNPAELDIPSYLRPHCVVVIEWAGPVRAFLRAQDQTAVVRRLLVTEPKPGQRRIVLADL